MFHVYLTRNLNHLYVEDDKYYMLGCAQTGTGKTCAFAVPILQRISDKKGIKALILTPTRELAAQIYDNCITYAEYTKQRSVVIFGGVKQRGPVWSRS